MALFGFVWKESEILYYNNENITGLNKVRVSWTGDKPEFALTNQGDLTDATWDNIALTTSAAELTHTFSKTGQNLKWKIVFISGKTEITEIYLEGDSSMTGETKLTNEYKKLVLDRIANAIPTRNELNQLKVGTGNTAPVITDTDLETPVPINNIEIIDNCEATTGWTASGTNSVTLNTSSYKRGEGALNLIKSDATSTAISVSKTTTSRNFTSKLLWFPIYISTDLYADLAVALAMTIRFGSDASNYYYKNYAKADLAAGWNWLSFSSTTATGTTGAPAIAACDYTYLCYNTDDAADTTAAGEFIFDELFLASSDDYFKALASGYPLLNYTEYNYMIQARIDTTQSNGFLIGEFAFVNDDAADEKMGIKTKITQISKGNTDEFIFSNKITVTINTGE